MVGKRTMKEFEMRNRSRGVESRAERYGRGIVERFGSLCEV